MAEQHRIACSVALSFSHHIGTHERNNIEKVEKGCPPGALRAGPVIESFVQVALKVFQQCRVAVPCQELIGPARGLRGIVHMLLSRGFGIILHSSSRCSLARTSAFFPAAEMVKRRFLRPPRSLVAPPSWDLT